MADVDFMSAESISILVLSFLPFPMKHILPYDYESSEHKSVSWKTFFQIFFAYSWAFWQTHLLLLFLSPDSFIEPAADALTTTPNASITVIKNSKNNFLFILFPFDLEFLMYHLQGTVVLIPKAKKLS